MPASRGLFLLSTEGLTSPFAGAAFTSVVFYPLDVLAEILRFASRHLGGALAPARPARARSPGLPLSPGWGNGGREPDLGGARRAGPRARRALAEPGGAGRSGAAAVSTGSGV